MKTVLIAICVWGLIACAACAQEQGYTIRKRPIEGMGGYDVIIREAQEPEIRVYGTVETGDQKVVTHETHPSLEPEKAAAKLSSIPEEAAPQNLRRQRIPLRRNRYMLLKQQAFSPNISQELK